MGVWQVCGIYEEHYHGEDVLPTGLEEVSMKWIDRLSVTEMDKEMSLKWKDTQSAKKWKCH